MAGELDSESALATAATVRRLAADKAARFELDLTEVTFIDSVGLRELLRLRQRLPMLRIVGVSPRIERMFAITGTTELLLDAKAEPPLPNRR